MELESDFLPLFDAQNVARPAPQTAPEPDRAQQVSSLPNISKQVVRPMAASPREITDRRAQELEYALLHTQDRRWPERNFTNAEICVSLPSGQLVLHVLALLTFYM